MANTKPATAAELRRYAAALADRRRRVIEVRNRLDRAMKAVDWEGDYPRRWRERVRRRIADLNRRIAALDTLVYQLERAAANQ
jgi:hypothetical protein